MTLDRMKIKAVMQIIAVVDIILLLAQINLMTKQQVGVDSNEI